MISNDEFVALARQVAALNADNPEIGAGMLKYLAEVAQGALDTLDKERRQGFRQAQQYARTHTITYATLEVSNDTFQDVKARLIKAVGEREFQSEYWQEELQWAHRDEPEPPRIVLGTIALVAVKKKGR